jgi:cyclopropane fatty-acyl-phospholipid synthase-like methyltransferase
VSLKNWDNKTWLSSKKYIKTFNNFLLKRINLNKNSQILDIGCGRGKILGSLFSKLRLKNKPVGIDIEIHKDRDKRIDFQKIDVIKYLKKNKKKFDLILIKQTIHLLKFQQIKKLLLLCNGALNPKGKIMIFTLETFNNEIPTFLLMKKKLRKSLIRDKKIIQYISKLHTKNSIKKFSFKVKITKKKYIKMIENRYISTLLNFKLKEISHGINEIKSKYSQTIHFDDKLICLILNK